MDQTVFTKVMSNVTFITKKCAAIAGAYRRGTLTNKACGAARKLQGDMDKILMDEVYHIIGMGSLTQTQQVGFANGINALSQYRPIIKYVASLQTAAGASEKKIKPSVYRSILAGEILRR